MLTSEPYAQLKIRLLDIQDGMEKSGPPSNAYFLEPTESTTQTASRLVQAHNRD